MSQTKDIPRSRCTIEFLAGKSNGVYDRWVSRPAGFWQLLPRLEYGLATAGAGDRPLRSISAVRDCAFLPLDDLAKSRQGRRHKLSRRRRDKARESAGGGQVLRNEAYREVRCNDER